MALEYRPPFQIDPNAPSQQQRSLATLGQTFSNLGDTAMQYSQQSKENKIRQAMLALQQQKGQRDQLDWNRENTDQSPFGGSPDNGAFPSGAMGTGPAPNYSMQTGQDAYVPQGDTAPQPIDHTANFMAWKQKQQNPMSGLDMNSVMGLSGSRNRSEGLAFLKDKQISDLQASEIAKNNALAKKASQPNSANDRGTWHQNPQTGEMQWYPTVMPGGPGGGGQPPQGGGSVQGATGQVQLPYKDRVKLELEKPKAQGSLNDTLQQYDNMIAEAQAIRNDPSVGTATGLTSFTQSIPGTGSKRVGARLDTLKAKTLINVLGSLKELSKNGASGFGALSEKEGEAIRNSVATLDSKQSTPDFQAGIDRFIKEMSQRKQNLQNTFASTYGGGQQQAPAGSVQTQQYEHTATGKDGSKIGWDGQKWVPIQ